MNKVIAGAVATVVSMLTLATPTAAQFGPEGTIVAPTAEMPSLTLGLASSPGGGWTIGLNTARFTFGEGTGQAILIVDDGAPATVTGQSIELPELTPGVHEVIVALADPLGRVFVDEAGRLAAERLVIVVPQGPFPVDVLETAIALVGGAVVGEAPTARPAYNSGVALRWTTDAAVELHVHGFDIEIELEPELPTTIVFVADMYGRFPTELHAPGREATVLFIEVAP